MASILLLGTSVGAAGLGCAPRPGASAVMRGAAPGAPADTAADPDAIGVAQPQPSRLSASEADEVAVYAAVVERASSLASPGVAPSAPILVADRTYTCARRAKPAAPPVEDGATVVFGPPIAAHRSLSKLTLPGAAAPRVQIVSAAYLAAHAGEGLAIYFSPVLFLDAARATAMVQVLLGTGVRDFTCTTWMMERRGDRYGYVRGEGAPAPGVIEGPMWQPFLTPRGKIEP